MRAHENVHGVLVKRAVSRTQELCGLLSAGAGSSKHTSSDLGLLWPLWGVSDSSWVSLGSSWARLGFSLLWIRIIVAPGFVWAALWTWSLQ